MFAAGMGQATLDLEKPGRPAVAGTTPSTIGADAVCAVTRVDSNAYARADSDGVQLNLTKQQARDLPPVDIDHPGV